MKSETNGINADRHLCKCCKYKAKGRGCDYFVGTGIERPYSVEDCILWADREESGENNVAWNPGNSFYESVAIGIANRASKDYIDACKSKHLRKFSNYGDKAACNRAIAECRIFFRSEWFFELTGLDGKDILKKLDRMIDGLKEKEWKKI